MSWFSDYVGKAESLLNALDSSAGDLLSNSLVESASADTSISGSSAAGECLVDVVATRDDAHGLSSSYLSQQSLAPSFAPKRSATVPPAANNGSSSRNLRALSSRGNGDSPSPPLVGGSRSSTSKHVPSKRTSSSISKREDAASSSTSPTPPYSLDSSRLSQRLMSGSVDGTDVESVFSSSLALSVPYSSSSSSTAQPTSKPVISSSHEDALLKFLNAPPIDATTATVVTAFSSNERNAVPLLSTPRASPANQTIGRPTTSLLEELNCADENVRGMKTEVETLKEEISKLAVASSVDAASTNPASILSIADEVAPESRPSTSFSAPSTATSQPLIVEAETPCVEGVNDTEINYVENPPRIATREPVVGSSLTQSSSSSSSSIVIVSPPPAPQQQQRQKENENLNEQNEEEEPTNDVAAQLESSGVEDGRTQKSSSSNGSSVSGSSVNGEYTDFSDVMKDSPSSPFEEESEPEMLPTSRDGVANFILSPDVVEMTSPSSVVAEIEDEMTSSGMRFFTSGPQTESEPEMIPTPPSIAGETRLMTSSQVSSSISQRFSDCEILSATELAEDDGREEVSSPPRKTSSVESASMEPASLESVVSVESLQSATAAASSAPDALSLSKLQLENQLLRSEIHSLNEEMQGAWRQAQMAKEERVRAIQSADAAEKKWIESENRARHLSDEYARDRKRHAVEAEERIRELERRLNDASSVNADAEMSLEAKDGQLAVLRVRLEEADAATDQLLQKCRAMEEENRRIVAGRETTVATHVAAFETLKAHVDRLQEQLDAKSVEGDRLRKEVFALENASAEEKEGLGSMVTSLQSEIATEKARCLSLQHQANGGQRVIEAGKKELEEYRAKAARTLQSKDRLIASLQEGSLSTSSTSALELEDVKNERDLLREELDSVQTELESCRAELADAETQAALDRDGFENRLSALEKELRETKERLELTTMDLTTSKQELSCAHDQLHRTKIQFQEEDLKKSEENENLKRQIQVKSSSSASSPDLEARLHALAENLIEKQTTIETLSTEKTSLKLQLERVSSSSSIKSSFSGDRRSPTAINISVEEDRPGFSNGAETSARMRLPLFLRETPEDTGVTRGVKRAATSLDGLGIKIGVFFRRYPIARVFAIVYAFLLHLWVFVVLLTYTPEMH